LKPRRNSPPPEADNSKQSVTVEDADENEEGQREISRRTKPSYIS